MTTPAPGSFKIKANDRKPSIQTTLSFAGSATVPNLTGVGTVVNFIMRTKGPDGLPSGTTPKVNAAAVIADAAAAVVRYDWAVGDTAAPGAYLVEWEVIYPDGLTQTFPTDAYNDVFIYADLDGAA